MKKHLSVLILTATIWSLCLYFYSNPVFFDNTAWLKITASLTIIIVFALFYFIAASKNLLQKFKIFLIAAAAICSVVILTFFIGDLLGITGYLLGLTTETAVLFLLFLVYAGLGAAILLERVIPGPPATRLETLYTLIFFAVFVIAITVVYVFIPLIAKTGQYLWLGPLFTVIFILFFILGHYLIKKTDEESAKKEEAEKLAEEWKKLTEAKDQFLLSLQHHLRTPLTPFKIYLERILDGTYGREENPVIREKLIEMNRSVNTLYSLIESLLDIQELKAGKKILEPEDCRIKELIKSVIEELKPHAEEKGLYLVFEPDEREKITILKTDKKRTREALWNLVDNAIKYTKKGGVKIKLETGRFLKIIVSDTGIGMAKEEIESFLKGELFSRGAEAKKLFGPGRGIGLTIASEFIKAQDGRIRAESGGSGKGTTFWIELPIR